MEAVVVAGREVDDVVVEFGARGLLRVTGPPRGRAGEVGADFGFGAGVGLGGLVLGFLGGGGRGAGEEVGERVGDAVHVCEFFIGGEGLCVWRVGLGGLISGVWGEDVGWGCCVR